MNEQELRDFLKNNLRIVCKEHNPDFCPEIGIRIEILLEDEVISGDTFLFPRH